MRTTILTSIIAGTIALAAAPASAAPVGGAQPLPLASAQPDVTPVSGGCGPFRHRGFNGFCYPGGGFYGRPFYRPYGYYRPYGFYRRGFY